MGDATVVVPPMPALDPVWNLLIDSGFRELLGYGPSALGADIPRPALDGPTRLPDLLDQARSASGLTRIKLRDPIAAFGTTALGPLVALAHDGFEGFAIQTIKRIGELGARPEAAAALRELEHDGLTPGLRSDLDAATALLILPRKAPTRRPLQDGVAAVVGRLEVGSVYRRLDLHRAGSGGNRQKGISYPAGGDHVLPQADPAGPTSDTPTSGATVPPSSTSASGAAPAT